MMCSNRMPAGKPAVRYDRQADVAQLAEHRFCKPGVAGSIPAVGSASCHNASPFAAHSPSRATWTRVHTRGTTFILIAMDTEQARELLVGARERIERALANLAPADVESVTDPFEAADVGGDLLDAEIGEGRAERLSEELRAIGRAEQRLAEGTYGISVESGEPIPDGRLQAIPWAERTAEEQARYEASGG